MTAGNEYPSKAEMLAGLIKKQADISMNMATVQRSHRFPMVIFSQIENMAKMAGVPVSLIINELLEVGLEALAKELSEDEHRQINSMSKDQFERPAKQYRVDTEKLKSKK